MPQDNEQVVCVGGRGRYVGSGKGVVTWEIKGTPRIEFAGTS